jgi:hypothetical protein
MTRMIATMEHILFTMLTALLLSGCGLVNQSGTGHVCRQPKVMTFDRAYERVCDDYVQTGLDPHAVYSLGNEVCHFPTSVRGITNHCDNASLARCRMMIAKERARGDIHREYVARVCEAIMRRCQIECVGGSAAMLNGIEVEMYIIKQ